MGTCIPCYAEEIGPGRHYRWNWTYINASGTVRKCRLKLSNDYLSGNWASYYNDTVNHWNTLGTQFNDPLKDKVYAYDVAFANAKCDLYTASSNSFMYTNPDYAALYGISVYKNSNNSWSIDPLTGEESTFLSGTITYAACYFARSPDSANAYRYYMRHEIGHVFGMGHVFSDSSIMIWYWAGGNNYKVRLHDITVLEGFYPNPG